MAHAKTSISRSIATQTGDRPSYCTSPCDCVVKTGSFFLITAVLIAVLVRSVDPWVLPLVLIAVPFERGYEAIRSVETLRDRITPHLYITELPAIAADDLWMSMAYQGAFAAAPHRPRNATTIVAIPAT